MNINVYNRLPLETFSLEIFVGYSKVPGLRLSAGQPQSKVKNANNLRIQFWVLPHIVLQIEMSTQAEAPWGEITLGSN